MGWSMAGVQNIPAPKKNQFLAPVLEQKDNLHQWPFQVPKFKVPTRNASCKCQDYGDIPVIYLQNPAKSISKYGLKIGTE